MIAALRQTEKKEILLPMMVVVEPTDWIEVSNLDPAVPARMNRTTYCGTQAYLSMSVIFSHLNCTYIPFVIMEDSEPKS